MKKTEMQLTEDELNMVAGADGIALADKGPGPERLPIPTDK